MIYILCFISMIGTFTALTLSIVLQVLLEPHLVNTYSSRVVKFIFSGSELSTLFYIYVRYIYSTILVYSTASITRSIWLIYFLPQWLNSYFLEVNYPLSFISMIHLHHFPGLIQMLCAITSGITRPIQLISHLPQWLN